MPATSLVRCLSIRTFENLVDAGLIDSVDYFYSDNRRSGGVRAYTSSCAHDFPEDIRWRYCDRPTEDGRLYVLLWMIGNAYPCEANKLVVKRNELTGVLLRCNSVVVKETTSEVSAAC